MILSSTLEFTSLIWVDDFGKVILFDFVALVSPPWFFPSLLSFICTHYSSKTSLNPGYYHMFQTTLLLYNPLWSLSRFLKFWFSFLQIVYAKWNLFQNWVICANMQNKYDGLNVFSQINSRGKHKPQRTHCISHQGKCSWRELIYDV